MPSLKKNRYEGGPSGAGLIRYFDVDEGGPKLDPKLIIGIIVVMIFLELMSKIIL